MENCTSIFLHEFFMKENSIYTSSIDNPEQPNCNSINVGSYLWYQKYEDVFTPHLFICKKILNEVGFKRDFNNIKKHELFKERIDVLLDDEPITILVYPFNKMWQKRLIKLINTDFTWLPKNDIPYKFKHILNRTPVGYKMFRKSLESFGINDTEINKIIKEAKVDKRPLYTGFSFKNECIACTTTDINKFHEWITKNE